MMQSKTQPIHESVDARLAAIAGEARRADCRARVAPMRGATGRASRTRGPKSVDFGSDRCGLAGGREGVICATGSQPPQGGIGTCLLAAGPVHAAPQARFGRHRTGKARLDVRRLTGADEAVRQPLVAHPVAEVGRRHGAIDAA